MTKENIDLLKEFLQAILPFLIIIILVVLFLYYRKSIETFFSKITKIKGKIAGQEFETEIKETIIEVSGDKVTKLAEDTEEKSNVEQSMFDLWKAYDDKDWEKGQHIFEQVQLKETDPIKKVRNKIYYFYSKAINGNTESVVELEEYSSTIKYNEEKAEAYEYLGHIKKHGRAYLKAIEEYDRAIATTQNEVNKSNLIKYVSESYFELGKFDLAEKRILELFNELSDEKGKCICMQALAEAYNKQKKHFQRILALSKAIEYEPNNTSILFNLAYSCSECDLNSLTILHYKTLLFFDGKNANAHNNLGVSYQHFSMPLKGNNEYKQSHELGNTLASGNLANNFLYGGFIAEAKKIIDEAKIIKDYDNKVDESIDEINKKSKEEEDKEILILKSAKDQERFLKTFYEKEFSNNKEEINLTGEWSLNEDTTIINNSSESNKIELSWLQGQAKFEIKGIFRGLTSVDIEYIDLRPGYTSLIRKSLGYAYINLNPIEIYIIVLIENSYEIIELVLKKL